VDCATFSRAAACRLKYWLLIIVVGPCPYYPDLERASWSPVPDKSAKWANLVALAAAKARDLLGRCAGVQKVGDGGDKLRGRERLLQQDAVWDTPGWSLCRAHINDGKFRVDFSGLPGDFPTIYFAAQPDVAYERPVLACYSLEKGDRLFAGWGNSRFKSALGDPID
jgi:hypothetical protein